MFFFQAAVVLITEMFTCEVFSPTTAGGGGWGGVGGLRRPSEPAEQNLRGITESLNSARQRGKHSLKK